MKRIFALILVAVLLCGCSATVAPSANSDASSHTGKVTGSNAEVTPTEATLPSMESYAEDTGLVVTFEMGAEFEMVLNMFHAVLEVNPLNEVAEALLDGIDVAGVSYRSAVEAILQEAKNQELLKYGTTITLTAKAVGTDSWTVASHNILTWPVENCRKTIGLYFTCELIAPGKYFDDQSYTNTFTRKTDDLVEVVCYDPSGAHQMTYAEFEDGSYLESYYPSWDRILDSWYKADGSFVFANYDSHGSGLTYTLYPDGSCEGQRNLYDAAGNLIMYASTYLDGSSYEAYYENGVTVRDVNNGPDGSFTESTYAPDGTLLTWKSTDSSGNRNEQTFFPNGNPAIMISELADGSYNESEYYENNTLKRNFWRNADGSFTEYTYFPNGNPATIISESADGSYSESEFYENNTLKRSFYHSADGTETETFYDENGNPIPAATE